jgi:hypothetical protein
MIARRVAECQAIQVGDANDKECRKSLLHRSQVGIASQAVPRLDRREFRQRDQDLTNSLDDLLLLCRGEPSQAERLVLHFDLARTAQHEFIVRLDRDRRQKRDSHQQE